MQVIKTEFEGVLIFKPTVFRDTRGEFYEDWHEARYQEAGVHVPFIQDDFSISKKYVLRGLHGQPGQERLIQTVVGKVWDVLVDIRPQSKTFKRYFSIILSEDEPAQVFAPAGFVHGFCVLSDQAIMHYKCSAYYDKAKEFGFRWNDPAFHIDWPNENFILSAKDSAQPFFNYPHEL
ncbi:MAG: dTDP-4-dehydrorhamnose 3,5-epimerase [Puniceicoccales bacterium]|jgi:dTDP-4-dehydrorhamnose 3,5-epimerase|nr:dTDP-4-dehydrorhamnose 3,5-epimerase [Puniceicoccales bacterium]